MTPATSPAVVSDRDRDGATGGLGRWLPADGRRVLADGWQVSGCLGDTWRWRCGPGRPPGEPGWFDARVPDPYHGLNSRAAEWVPQRTWLYRRVLETEPLAPGQRAVLRFEGVDHDVTVLLDGRELATHRGMFTPFEVEVTRELADGGSHLLAVAVHPAPPSEPQVGRTDRVRVHKSRMTYGWDFCPRMIHQGIWKPVALEITGPLRLVDTHLRSWLVPEPGPTRDDAATDTRGPDDPGAAVAEEPGGDGRIAVRAHLTATAPGVLTAEVHDPDDGRVVARSAVPVAPGDTEAHLVLPVARPRRWWPNGHGPQTRYPVAVTLRDGAGQPVGGHHTETGFRDLRLVPNPGAPSDALPYTLQVNGRRVHAKGWNWVPMDAQHGVPRPDRLEHLLKLAADAHVTLLRVWGGGLVETEEFYRACDRLGLLVWQEFALSSSGIDSVPSDDPQFLRLMEEEARALVPALGHHPALAVWGPGNELHDTALARPLDERSSPVIAVLAAVVAELDPHRAWLPGSPSGRAFLHRADVIAADPEAQHDVHGPWEHQGLGAQEALYDAGTCLLHSEFGVEGMANRRTWEAVVPAGQGWPTGRDNPIMEHLGAWWNNTPVVQAAFGGRITDTDTMRRASQQLQYDGLRYAVEATLRRAPRASGALPWQFDEPFPNAWCTSAVDHRGDPKPAYHGVRRAYRPDHVCARVPGPTWAGRETFTAELWSWRQPPAAGPAAPPDGGHTVTARLVDLWGTPLAEHTLPAGAPTGAAPATSVPAARAGEWRTPLTGTPGRGPLFLLDLALRTADGQVLATNRYLHSRTTDLAPLLTLEPAEVEATVEDGLGTVLLRHRGGPAALGLWLTDARPIDAPGWAVFGDNLLDLLPGESARIPVEWRAAPARGRAIRLEGWNVRVRELR